MASSYSNTHLLNTQGTRPGLSEVKAVLDSVDVTDLLDRLWKYRWNGRPGYPLEALWRAYLARFILNLPSINELIRRLQDDPKLRLVCGFSQMPHRTTFNRFVSRLSHHQDLVNDALSSITSQLKATLPGFAEKVSLDSTAIYTHSNPNRKVVSDPEASWTAKNAASSKDGKEWHFGYKYHAVVDATYGVPIAGFTTTAKRNDSPELSRLLKQAASTFDWFSPLYVMADKGYDSLANHEAVMEYGAVPIIAIRRAPKGKKWEGVYDEDGAPTCIGQVPMQYVRSDPQEGHLYRCPPEGCKLKDRQGVRYCQDQLWENRKDNLRLFGPVRRGSPEWKRLYSLRQSVERVFKSLKQSRCLERHCVRGLRKVGLHATMSVLAFQATVLANYQAGQVGDMRWQVRKIA